MKQTINTELLTAIKELIGGLPMGDLFDYDHNCQITPLGEFILRLEHVINNWDLVQEVKELYNYEDKLHQKT